jgi:hypothetical protein
MESKKEGAPETAYYDLHGTKWKQEQGTYEEDCKTNEIIERMQTDVKITSIVMGLDQFMANALLPEMFTVVFKPHTPTPWSKIRQRFYAWKNNVDLQAPILCMQKWQRRKVLQDFFVLNKASMISSMSSEFISTLISMNSKIPMEIRPDGKSPFTMPSMEASPQEKQ